ncbi:MAG: glycosyltransferase family 9 protein [Pseudobdellovibrionaceae bacterium]
MKILLLSLLRLGDILNHRELARNLKIQYPGCEIHFLIYRQFQSVEKLLPEVNKWIYLDRKEIQSILVERSESPLKAYQKITGLMKTVSGQQYDLILNATHNRLSVRLMDLLQANEKRGVAFEKGQKANDQNHWQTYLNENFSEVRGSRFHYLEVLQKSLEISFRLPKQAEKRAPHLILIQLLTSDRKKNWGLKKFFALKKKLEAEFPNDRILGICSPQEKAEVEKVFTWNEFLTPNLEEAAQLLKEARLLITGDTSIQHLAAHQGCPVVSLFLGSADPVKTAPWQLGAWVIQGQAECAPCSHSQACHQASHLCADSLSVETVFSLVDGILKEKEICISKSKIFRTSQQQNSFSLVPLNESFPSALEQTVWSVYLNGSRISQDDIQHLRAQETQVKKIWRENERFKLALEDYQKGQIELSQIEAWFPFWKDSFTRLKRDLRGWVELQELNSIRTEILKALMVEREFSQNGNTRSKSEKHFAQA